MFLNMFLRFCGGGLHFLRKSLGIINIDVFEILRFALNDNEKNNCIFARLIKGRIWFQ